MYMRKHPIAHFHLLRYDNGGVHVTIRQHCFLVRIQDGVDMVDSGCQSLREPAETRSRDMAAGK